MNSVKLCSPIVIGFINSTVSLNYVQDVKSIGITRIQIFCQFGIGAIDESIEGRI